MPSVAAVDVGSNAIRLSMVAVSPTGRVISDLFQRWPLRLGHDVFSNGAIGDEGVRELVGVFRDISQRLEAQRVQAYRAVATSAMRDAANGREVIKQIRDTTGVALEIITGKDESRLARNALVRALGSDDRDVLVVDIGGGSVEVEGARARRGRSLPLGTVRLVERFPELARPLSIARLHELQDTIDDELRRRLKARGRFRIAVATGGNLDVLARVVPDTRGFWPAIDLSRLQELAEGLSQLTVDERREMFELRPDRADLILPTVLVVLAVRRWFKLDAFVVPSTGLRESILHDLVMPKVLGAGARSVVRRFGADVKLAQRRATLARSLFVGLTPVHRLWAPALGALEAAAYMQDTGALVDSNTVATHSGYLVKHAAGLGLDERGREVAAYALALASDGPLPESTGELRADDLPNARILGALLAFSDALVPISTRRLVRVDLLQTPIVVDAGLTRPVEPRALTLLERVLGHRLRVV